MRSKCLNLLEGMIKMSDSLPQSDCQVEKAGV